MKLFVMPATDVDLTELLGRNDPALDRVVTELRHQREQTTFAQERANEERALRMKMGGDLVEAERERDYLRGVLAEYLREKYGADPDGDTILNKTHR